MEVNDAPDSGAQIHIYKGRRMIRTVLFVLLALVVAAALVVLAGQLGLLAGQAPSLGVRDGRLKPPSRTPNSVSSQAQLYPDHPQKAYAAIAPLSFKGDPAKAMTTLAQVLAARPDCELKQQTPDYLYATCRTQLLRFTDDLEFALDAPAGVIQLRSSSRLGHGDRGVNRARMEAIRARFAQNQGG